jgi:hypothetical protein
VILSLLDFFDVVHPSHPSHAGSKVIKPLLPIACQASLAHPCSLIRHYTVNIPNTENGQVYLRNLAF